MFLLIDSLLPSWVYFFSETFLAQTQVAYYATPTLSLRKIRRKPNKRILEMHKIL